MTIEEEKTIRELNEYITIDVDEKPIDWFQDEHSELSTDWSDVSRYFSTTKNGITLIRPTLKFSPILFDEIINNAIKFPDGKLYIEFGYYPQKEAADEAKDLYNNSERSRKLRKTFYTYTINVENEDGSFTPEFDVYENTSSKNKDKYIKVDFVSNSYLYKVSPLIWTVNPKERLLVCEKYIVAGSKSNHPFLQYELLHDLLQFDTERLYQILANYFEKNIQELERERYTFFNKTTADEVEDLASKMRKLKKDAAHEEEAISSFSIDYNLLSDEYSLYQRESERNAHFLEVLKLIDNSKNDLTDAKAILNSLEYQGISVRTAEVTDFAILTNARVKDYQLNTTEKRFGCTRLGSTNIAFNYDGVVPIDDVIKKKDEFKNFAIRPIINSEVIYEEARKNAFIGLGGTITAKYGDYPQKVASKEMQKTLNKALKKKKLLPLSSHISILVDGQIVNCPIYVYNDQKYVAIKVDVNLKDTKLSDGVKYSDGDYAWVEVNPVEWILDEKNKLLISKKGLIANVPNTHVYNFVHSFLTRQVLSLEEKEEIEYNNLNLVTLIGEFIEQVQKLKNNNNLEKARIMKRLKEIILILKNRNVNTSNLELIVSSHKK